MMAADLPHPDPDLPDPKRMDRLLAKAGTLISTVFRQIRTETRNAQLNRVREIDAPRPIGPDGEDHGMDLGPAALERPSAVKQVDGRIRGAGQKLATPVYARMVDASTLFERMNIAGQLSDRMAKAGHKLWALKRAAGIEQCVTARYAVVQDETVDPADDSEADRADCPDGYDPLTYHRWVLRQLPSHMAGLLDRACDWTVDAQFGHPGVRWLGTFQEGLVRLADLWGIDE